MGIAGSGLVLGLGFGGAKVMLNLVEEDESDEVMKVRMWRRV